MSKKLLSKKTKTKLLEIKRRPPDKLDRMVQTIHEEVFADTNCLDCGECCKKIPARLNRNDILRLASALNLKFWEFSEKYVTTDNDGDTILKTLPCPFLEDDNHCSVYNDRPFSCRDYPHTDRRRFYQLIDVSIKNAHFCPPVVTILEKLVQEWELTNK